MFPRIDSCELTIRYPSFDQELDSCLPLETIPAHHRWIKPDSSWEELLVLHALVVPPVRTGVPALSPAQIIADLVEYALEPTVKLAQQEFPDELNAFSQQVWNEAFESAPSQSLRLVCLNFAGPVWACAGTVSMASDLSVLVALRVAGGYRAVASRDPRVRPGTDLEIDWSGPTIRDYRPKLS
ncbi:MAG: hypothetical protein M3Y56_02095 [Armatimonadota bacterium]|nr:hypothetical protein [Armatimonadota bacterium]